MSALRSERRSPFEIPAVILGSVEVQLFPLRIPRFKFAMDRYVLTDAQWTKMEPHCRGKKSDPGRSGADNRRFVEAVLWIARTGSPWRDLPALFGHWNTVFKRYRDWVKADIFKRLFDAASDEPDMESGPFNSCGEDGADGGAGVSGECFAGGIWFATAAADQGKGAIAQVGQGDRGVAGADAAGILGEGAVFDAEGAVLDAPMGAGEFEQSVGAGRLFG